MPAWSFCSYSLIYGGCNRHVFRDELLTDHIVCHLICYWTNWRKYFGPKLSPTQATKYNYKYSRLVTAGVYNTVWKWGKIKGVSKSSKDRNTNPFWSFVRWFAPTWWNFILWYLSLVAILLFFPVSTLPPSPKLGQLNPFRFIPFFFLSSCLFSLRRYAIQFKWIRKWWAICESSCRFHHTPFNPSLGRFCSSIGEHQIQLSTIKNSRLLQTQRRRAARSGLC